jgi:hypothetical protein
VAGARLKAVTAELAAAQDAQLAARRIPHNITEREAAGAFFRALDLKACPRCATPIDEQRRAHQADEHVCSVCDRPAEYEPDVTARERAQDQVTTDAVDSAAQALAEARTEHGQIAGQRAYTLDSGLVSSPVYAGPYLVWGRVDGGVYRFKAVDSGRRPVRLPEFLRCPRSIGYPAGSPHYLA